MTEGRILGYDKENLTVDAEVLPGYKMPTEAGGIRLFTPEGVSLPHTQDMPQKVEDLGEPQAHASGLDSRASIAHAT